MFVSSVTGASSIVVRASHKSNIASVGLGFDAKKLICLKINRKISKKQHELRVVYLSIMS